MGDDLGQDLLRLVKLSNWQFSLHGSHEGLVERLDLVFVALLLSSISNGPVASLEIDVSLPFRPARLWLGPIFHRPSFEPTVELLVTSSFVLQ